MRRAIGILLHLVYPTKNNVKVISGVQQVWKELFEGAEMVCTGYASDLASQSCRVVEKGGVTNRLMIIIKWRVSIAGGHAPKNHHMEQVMDCLILVGGFTFEVDR